MSDKYEVNVNESVSGVLQKKLSVSIPVLVFVGIVLGKQTWNVSPLFTPELAWRIVMGIVAGMYIIGFWFDASGVEFTINLIPRLFPHSDYNSPRVHGCVHTQPTFD